MFLWSSVFHCASNIMISCGGKTDRNGVLSSKRRNHLQNTNNNWGITGCHSFVKKLKKNGIILLICRKMLYNSTRKIRGVWDFEWRFSIFHESGKYIFKFNKQCFLCFSITLYRILQLLFFGSHSALFDWEKKVDQRTQEGEKAYYLSHAIAYIWL